MNRLECKALFSVDEAGTITGTAWPFGSADRVGDVIEKGAFASPGKLPMLFDHDSGQAIGVWDSVTETAEGLSVKGRMLIDDVPRAREIRALVREGAVTGLSIGFVSKKSNTRRDGGRTITALDLLEVSVVAIPCHPGARITSAKSARKAAHMAHEDTGTAPDIADIETKLSAVETELKSVGKIADRLDKIEARLNRPAATDKTASNDNAGLERKAFMTFARVGEARMPPDEVKALVVANDAAGGYLAPEEFGREILKSIVEFSPIRQYARVITIGGSEIKYPRRVSGTAATWVAETADRTGSEPVFDQMTMTPYELATFTDVSTQLLEDNAYNLEGELSADFGESFGKTEGLAFVKGDGVGKPKGIMAATGIAEIKTGSASAFPTTSPADVLIGMYHSLPTTHAQNAVWLLNRKTLGVIRTWKNSAGDYLVMDPISAGGAATLLGRPIVEALDMDDIGANKFPILFGDMSGYRIVDRVGLSFLRDPYTLAGKGQVRFHARKRVGADVTHADRFVKLKVAA